MITRGVLQRAGIRGAAEQPALTLGILASDTLGLHGTNEDRYTSCMQVTTSLAHDSPFILDGLRRPVLVLYGGNRLSEGADAR